MVTKKERQEAEKFARSQYQDVLKVEVKEDPDNESSLILIITRGRTLPPIRMPRGDSKCR